MTWAHARLDASAGKAVPLPPVIETLKLGGLDRWCAGQVDKIWYPAPELLNVDGSLFGGYLAALADQMLAFAAMTVVPADRMFRTVNLQIGFFHVARAEPLHLTAEVVAQTRRMISCRVAFRTAEGLLIAEATAQQIVLPLS
ncbi:MAG: hypothetical protein RL490_877 [Pseudomonadota bacterium]